MDRRPSGWHGGSPRSACGRSAHWWISPTILPSISGGTLTMRRGAEGDDFVALDGHSYEVTDADVVIADASGVISLGGIMGGKSTGVTETTRNVFVECAL